MIKSNPYYRVTIVLLKPLFAFDSFFCLFLFCLLKIDDDDMRIPAYNNYENVK